MSAPACIVIMLIFKLKYGKYVYKKSLHFNFAKIDDGSIKESGSGCE